MGPDSGDLLKLPSDRPDKVSRWVWADRRDRSGELAALFPGAYISSVEIHGLERLAVGVLGRLGRSPYARGHQLDPCPGYAMAWHDLELCRASSM